MELKPGCKQTEVGVIPEEWEVRTLGSLTSLLTNGFVGTVKSAYVNGDDGVLYIQGYNVQENGFNFHGIKRVTNSFHDQHQKSCLQPGDLLTIQTGDIGITAVVPPELAGSNCHALVISRLDKQVSDPSFYCQYFNSERGRTAFKEIETGSTMKHLNVGDLKGLFLPSPPIEEQHVIAGALSDVDALISTLNRIIVKKRDLKQAAMQQLLTGKKRLPGFDEGDCSRFVQSDIGSYPSDWKLKSLESLVETGRGIRYGIVQPGKFDPAGRFMIRGQDYSNGWVAPAELFQVSDVVEQRYRNARVQSGDLIMTIVGTCGIVETIPDWLDGANLTQTTARIAVGPKEAKADFCKYMLKTTVGTVQVANYMKGGVQPGINCGDLEKFLIPLPPTTAEQTAIAEVLSDMDAEIAALEQRRDKTNALKQGMMQELLTGKTRLI